MRKFLNIIMVGMLTFTLSACKQEINASMNETSIVDENFDLDEYLTQISDKLSRISIKNQYITDQQEVIIYTPILEELLQVANEYPTNDDLWYFIEKLYYLLGDMDHVLEVRTTRFNNGNESCDPEGVYNHPNPYNGLGQRFGYKYNTDTGSVVNTLYYNDEGKRIEEKTIRTEKNDTSTSITYETSYFEFDDMGRNSSQFTIILTYVDDSDTDVPNGKIENIQYTRNEYIYDGNTVTEYLISFDSQGNESSCDILQFGVDQYGAWISQ